MCIACGLDRTEANGNEIRTHHKLIRRDDIAVPSRPDRKLIFMHLNLIESFGDFVCCFTSMENDSRVCVCLCVLRRALAVVVIM